MTGTCQCEHCEGAIQFDPADQGQTTACPLCGASTRLIDKRIEAKKEKEASAKLWAERDREMERLNAICRQEEERKRLADLLESNERKEKEAYARLDAQESLVEHLRRTRAVSCYRSGRAVLSWLKVVSATGAILAAASWLLCAADESPHTVFMFEVFVGALAGFAAAAVTHHVGNSIFDMADMAVKRTSRTHEQTAVEN